MAAKTSKVPGKKKAAPATRPVVGVAPRLPRPATRCTMCQSRPFSGIMLSMAFRAPAGAAFFSTGRACNFSQYSSGACRRAVAMVRRAT